MLVKRGLLFVLLVVLSSVTVFSGDVGSPCNYQKYGDSQCNPKAGIYCINNVCSTHPNVHEYCNPTDADNNEYVAANLSYRYRTSTGDVSQGQLRDSCANSASVQVQSCESNCRVFEYGCRQNPEPFFQNYNLIPKNCPGKCMNGACVQVAPASPPQPTSKRGMPCNYATNRDSECDPTNPDSSQRLHCVNNVCSYLATQPSCFDTSNPKINFQTQDSVTYSYRGPQGQPTPSSTGGHVNDRCRLGTSGQSVSECEGPNCYVEDYFCVAGAEENEYPLDIELIPCQQCVEGRCIAQESLSQQSPPNQTATTNRSYQFPISLVACNDNNLCTTDVYNPTRRQCQFTPIVNCCQNQNECADGRSCIQNRCCLDSNTDMVCDGNNNDGATPSQDQTTPMKQCPTACDDTNICTVDLCNTQLGQCSYTSIPGCEQNRLSRCQSNNDCSDANRCTFDRCAEGVCSNQPIPYCIDQEAIPAPWDMKDTTQCAENSYLCYLDAGVAYECVDGKWLAIKAEDRFCSQSICKKGDYMCVDDPAAETVVFCNPQTNTWGDPRSEHYRDFCAKGTPTGYSVIQISGAAVSGASESSVVVSTPLLARPDIPRRVFRVVPLQKEQCEIKDITYVEDSQLPLVSGLQTFLQKNTITIGSLALLLGVSFVMGSFFLGKYYGKRH